MLSVINGKNTFRRMVSQREAANRFPELTRAVWTKSDALFPVRITRSWFGRVLSATGPLGLQSFPHPQELEHDDGDLNDPVGEMNLSPVKWVIQKHPDRALLIVTRRCHLYCRYCFRRTTPHNEDPTVEEMCNAINYLRTSGVNEVILSGGDPLFLKDRRLFNIIDELYRFVNIVRIHTRAVITSPDRVTNSFVERISKYKGLWLILHINHSNELCDEVCAKISGLKESGVSLLNQSVLLRGVNDDAKILACLSQRLLSLGVFPYYLHHPDNVTGNVSFRVSIDEGLKIYEQLSKSISGIALPRYVIDPPDGTGKIDVKDYWRNCGS